MSLETYRKQVIACQQNLGKLQAEKGRFSLKAVAALKKKQEAIAAATRSKSLSVINAKGREALRHESDHNKFLIEMAKIDRKIARSQMSRRSSRMFKRRLTYRLHGIRKRRTSMRKRGRST